MKKALSILLVVLILASAGGAVVINQPTVVAAISINSFTEGLLSRSELSVVSDILSQGSMQVSLTEVREDGEDILGDSSFSGKIYFSEDALMATDVDVNVEGVNFSGDVYLSNEEFYVTEENILEGSYGFEYDTIARELSRSIFAPDSGSDYAFDESVYNDIIDGIEAVENTNKMSKDAKKLLTDVLKDVEKIILDNAEITSSDSKVRLHGEKTDVRLVQITVDDEATQDIIMDVYEYLRESDEIVDFIEEYEDSIVTMFNISYDDKKYDSLAEAYEEVLEEAEESVEETCDSVPKDFEVVLNIATPKFLPTLLKVELEVQDEVVVSIDCGKDGIKETDKIVIEYANQVITYQVAADNTEKFDASLTLHYDYEYTSERSEEKRTDEMEYRLTINRKRDKYAFVMRNTESYYQLDKYYHDEYAWDYEYTTTFEGNMSTNGTVTEMTIDKISTEHFQDYKDSDTSDYGSESVIELDCEIVFNTNDKMPKPLSTYKTISKIKEEDIERWIENIEESVN